MGGARSVAVGFAGALAVSAAIATDSGPLKDLPVTKLKFFEVGGGPLQAATAYGDLQKGPHGTFIKMPPGFVSLPHTHTEDYYAVGISGVRASGGPETPHA